MVNCSESGIRIRIFRSQTKNFKPNKSYTIAKNLLLAFKSKNNTHASACFGCNNLNKVFGVNWWNSFRWQIKKFLFNKLFLVAVYSSPGFYTIFGAILYPGIGSIYLIVVTSLHIKDKNNKTKYFFPCD